MRPFVSLWSLSSIVDDWRFFRGLLFLQINIHPHSSSVLWNVSVLCLTSTYGTVRHVRQSSKYMRRFRSRSSTRPRVSLDLESSWEVQLRSVARGSTQNESLRGLRYLRNRNRIIVMDLNYNNSCQMKTRCNLPCKPEIAWRPK